MEHLALSLAVVGAAILALPFLDPKDDRARIALFGICILLIWRYLWWRFDSTLPALEWRFDSLFAWGFSIAEAIAILGWIIGFVWASICWLVEQRFESSAGIGAERKKSA